MASSYTDIPNAHRGRTIEVTDPKGRKRKIKVRSYEHGALAQGLERGVRGYQGADLGANLSRNRSSHTQRVATATGAALGASLPPTKRSTSHRRADGWWKPTGIAPAATSRAGATELKLRRHSAKERRAHRIMNTGAGGVLGGVTGGMMANLHGWSNRRFALGAGLGGLAGGALGFSVSPLHHSLEYHHPKKQVKKVWVNPEVVRNPAARRALSSTAEEASRRVSQAKKPQINRKGVRGLLTSKPVQKSESPVVPDYRGRANYRTGTAGVGKRMTTGAVAGVAKPKRVTPPRNPARSTPGAGMPTTFSSKPPIHPSLVGKRSRNMDPDERRNRRLGMGAGALALGGGGLVTSGVRGIRRDSQHRKAIDPAVIHVPNEPTRPATHKLEGGKRVELTGPERKKAQALHDERLGRYTRHKATREALETAHRSTGFHVSPRSGGKLGGGVAALAGSAALIHHGHNRANRRWS